MEPQILHFSVGLMCLAFLIFLGMSLAKKDHSCCKADEVEEAIMERMATNFIEECKCLNLNPEKIFKKALAEENKECIVTVQPTKRS